MDLIINLLIWVHIIAFIAGGASSVAGPVVAARLPSATPDAKLAYYGLMNSLSQIGKSAMVTLLVTGVAILWLKYGGLDGASVWFWVKMALIVVMLVAIIYGGIQFKKAQAGDATAARLADGAHVIISLALLGVLLSAVLAFN